MHSGMTPSWSPIHRKALQRSARSSASVARIWVANAVFQCSGVVELTRTVASRWEQKRWCSWALASVGFRPMYTATLLLLYWAAIEARNSTAGDAWSLCFPVLHTWYQDIVCLAMINSYSYNTSPETTMPFSIRT